MDEIKEMAKTVAQCIKGDTKKTHGYDTAATVKRIDGGTAYVSIPAGVPETPVKKTIDAKVGDTVQVHVENGTAWLVGNQTAPPTDDAEALVAKAVAKVADQNATKAKTTADEAQATANAVSGIANTALSQAQEAKQIADDTEQHFWFTETGTDTGAHITEVTQEEWNDPSDPNYQSGGNLLARSNGIAVREGTTELASFSANNGIIIGKIDEAHIGINNARGLSFYKPNETDTKAYISPITIQGQLGLYLNSNTATLTRSYNSDIEVVSTDYKSEITLSTSESTTGGRAAISLHHDGTVLITGDIDAAGKASFGAINGTGLFGYTTVSMTSSSISANASGEVTSSASTNSKYYPLAITNVNISTGQASLRRFYFSTQEGGRAVVKIGLQNDGTSAKTISVSADILWVKIAV